MCSKHEHAIFGSVFCPCGVDIDCLFLAIPFIRGKGTPTPKKGGSRPVANPACAGPVTKGDFPFVTVPAHAGFATGRDPRLLGGSGSFSPYEDKLLLQIGSRAALGPMDMLWKESKEPQDIRALVKVDMPCVHV